MIDIVSIVVYKSPMKGYSTWILQNLGYNFLAKHKNWADIEWDYKNGINQDVPQNSCIFVYWKQGFENAPMIVKICLRSIILHSNGHKVIMIDESNLFSYVNFPEHILSLYKRGKIKEALFSDLIRTNLLLRYGGIWCDATLFMSRELPTYIEDSDFFMFNMPLQYSSLSPIKCSSWFIKACKNDELLHKVQNFLWTYFSNYEKENHYFIYHLSLCLIVNTNKSMQQKWDSKIYIDNVAAHTLQFLMKNNAPFQKHIYDIVIANSFIHKLTYKLNEEIVNSSFENFYYYFLHNNSSY